MQIVIKLSDKIYDTILDDEMPTNDELKVIVQRIYEGIPLPKGCGSLIDAKELRQDIIAHKYSIDFCKEHHID